MNLPRPGRRQDSGARRVEDRLLRLSPRVEIATMRTMVCRRDFE